MNFQSLGFLAFLTVTVCVCLTVSCRDRRAAELCLTFACLFFYIVGGGWAALAALLAGLCVSDAALRSLTAETKNRRLCLTLAAAWHIGVLAAFKWLSPGWVPLGLSFFTFQQLWLLKEAYTGGFRRSWRDNLLL